MLNKQTNLEYETLCCYVGVVVVSFCWKKIASKNAQDLYGVYFYRAIFPVSIKLIREIEQYNVCSTILIILHLVHHSQLFIIYDHCDFIYKAMIYILLAI
jgi:hypothetical protein